LQEVAGAFDDGVWLTLGAGHTFLKYFFAPFCDGVAITKRRKKGFVEFSEY
jgi:hypothetical protein